jgi:hypothetical protein
MTWRLVWHGPVQDAEYDVQGETEEDAMAVLMAYLNGDDVEAGEVKPVITVLVTTKTVREQRELDLVRDVEEQAVEDEKFHRNHEEADLQY